MGTRNLTVIIHENKIKLSQYGQWDGYFSCTGIKFLEFVKENLQGINPTTGKKDKELRKYRKEQFIEKVNCIEDIDNATYEKLLRVSDEIGTYNGENTNTSKFGIPFTLLFPTLSRDTGVKILDIIEGLADYEFNHKNQKLPISICTDSAWCEFINIINLDTDEIYMLTNHEFNIEPLKTCKLVEDTYKMNCWYKSKIKDIPSIKKIKEYKDSIGLDYWQKDNGEWVSN